MLPQVWAQLGVCGRPSEKTKKQRRKNRLWLVIEEGAKRNSEGSVVSEKEGAESKARGLMGPKAQPHA